MAEHNDKPAHPPELLRKYGWMLFGWTLLVGASVLWDKQQESQHTEQSAAAAARANISKDLLFRRWVTSHGGVYVPPTEHTPSNPYLKVPDRDVVTTTGKKLTLMNPAYVMREVQQDFSDEYGTKSHITSLKLLNPKNAPDAWEADALRSFEHGAKERQEMQQIDGQLYLRLMRPLTAEPGCLKCHGIQGYKAGDIRGGISTSVAMAPYLAREQELNRSQALTHGAIWLIGLMGIGFSFRRERKQVGERRKTEQQVLQLSLRNRMLLDSAGDGIYGLDIDGRCTFANPAASKLLGYTVDELIGRNLHSLFHHSRADGQPYPQDECPVHAAFKQGTASRGIDRYWRKDGSSFPVAFVSTPILDAGKITGAVVTFSDITERKQAEEQLQHSETSLAEAQRMAHLGNWNLDLVHNVLTWSDEIYRIFEIDPKKFGASYEAFLDAIHPDDRDMVNRAYTESVANRMPYDIVHRLLMKDGRIKYVNEKCETYYGEDGSPLRSVGTVHDITERRLAEDSLREKEERLALATLHNGVGIWDWNLVTQEMIWDDSMYALYHIRREDFSGTEEAWRKSLHPDDLERGDREVADAIAGRKPFDTEFRVVWPDGRIRHIKAVAKVFRDEQGTPLRMLGTNMDITDRKQAELKLRELNNDFVTLLENTGDFIYFKDKDSRFVFCSQTMADITGHRSWHDMVGKHDLEVFPEEVAHIYYEEELPIFREGKPLLNKTDPYYDAQGRRRWVNTNKWPVFGDDRKTVVGIFGISRDITELKEAEDKINELNRDLEQRVIERTTQLEMANKELEAFSYSVSHDLRTPLRAIDGFSRILLEDYAGTLDEEGQRLLNVVRENAGRMNQLIDDILQFSRSGRLEIKMAEIDMEDMARGVIDELLSIIPEQHRPQVEIGHLPPAHGDRAMLHQVFANLLSNAIKFSRNSETPQVTVSGSVQNDEIVYSVKDNGAGFDMQYADKLFGVFQRLHSVTDFEGTGIGLAIVKRIVTRHGGRIWAEGKLNEGATFHFTLPVKTEQQP